MNLANIVEDLPRKGELSVSDFMDIVNMALCLIVEAPINEPIEVNDWVIFKVDERTINIRERHQSADMARFLHDEFSVKRFIKEVEIL